MAEVLVRICPNGSMTVDVPMLFRRVPCVGEYIDHGGVTYRVVDVHWVSTKDLNRMDPMVVAHSLDRPRAMKPYG